MSENINNTIIQSDDLSTQAVAPAAGYAAIFFKVYDELGNTISLHSLTNTVFVYNGTKENATIYNTQDYFLITNTNADSSSITGTFYFSYKTESRLYKDVSVEVATLSSSQIGSGITSCSDIILEPVTLSDQITRLQTAKDDIRTALNTLVPKMVDPELSIDKYGELITNVIPSGITTVKIKQINTEEDASALCNLAKETKQPVIIWWATNDAQISNGVKKFAALNWADYYGTMFAYTSSSFSGTKIGPVDLTKIAAMHLFSLTPLVISNHR